MKLYTTRLLTGLLVITSTVQIATAQVNVVIDQTKYISARSAIKSQPYLVLRDTSIQAKGANTVDIEASKAYCKHLFETGFIENESDCEPNYTYRSTATPNDPRWNQQYAHTRVSLPSAWDRTVGSSAVRIAIIDTGVDANHPDLAANIYTNSGETPDGIDNDSNGFIDDQHGWDFVSSDNLPADLNDHGTHCAGIAAGAGNNGVGISGASWNSSIMPLRVLDAEGSGFLSDIAAAVRYAADNGAQVLSLSLGGSSGSEILREALSYACSKGAFIAVAAGNESSNNDSTPAFPANYDLPCLMSVAASNSTDNYADFSNYGATKVHLAAPGVNILSTLPGNSYGNLSGTSMATPLVAGIGALVKAVNSSLSGSDVKRVLMDSADRLNQMSGLSVTGARVNANNALALATGTTPTPPDPDSGNPPGGDPGSDDPDGDEPGDEQAIEIDEAYVITNKKVFVSGYVYTVEDDFEVEGAAVNMTCIGRKRNSSSIQAVSRPTDEDGYFRIQLNKRNAVLLKGGTCFLRTDSTFQDTVAKLRNRR